MAKRDLPSPEFLCKALDYNPDTGLLCWRARDTSTIATEWRARGWNSRYAGRPAFVHKTQNGYLVGSVRGTSILAHIVAYAIYHKALPVGCIDHINGVKTDNRICNLRDVTTQENRRNSALGRNNTSGHSGVSWDFRRLQWEVRVRVNHKSFFIGRFACIDDAVAARDTAHKRHGFHPNHGKAVEDRATSVAR